jgi:phage-related protein
VRHAAPAGPQPERLLIAASIPIRPGRDVATSVRRSGTHSSRTAVRIRSKAAAASSTAAPAGKGGAAGAGQPVGGSRAAHPSFFAQCGLAGYISTDINGFAMAFKPVTFHGDSLERIRDFPQEARREAVHELYQVQKGLDPSDWKPMSAIGVGVREIRIRDAAGAYRVVYIATLADAIHVLHAFEKKSQKTAKRDIDLAAARLRQLRWGPG